MNDFFDEDDYVVKFKRGDCVNFSGTKNLKAVRKTYVWYVLQHMVVSYLIQHPDGNITKETLQHNNGFKDGFENVPSSQVKIGVKYILVSGSTLELIK